MNIHTLSRSYPHYDIERRNITQSMTMIMHKLFQRELFSYSLQQNFWKKQYRNLLKLRLLPFKAVCSLLPHYVTVFKPRERPYLFAAYLRGLAENVPEDIGGRYFWQLYQGKIPAHCKGQVCTIADTMCMVTRDALVSSIFGIKETRQFQRMRDLLQKKGMLKRVWVNIKKNSKILKSFPSNVCVYSFNLYAYYFFTGHTFILVQHLDKQGEIVYRLFQSYVNKYTLKEYLERHDNLLTQKELLLFLKGLQNCVISKKWNKTAEFFYNKYFKSSSGLKVGHINFCSRGEFYVRWGFAGIVDLLVQKNKFLEFQKNPDYPSFISRLSSIMQ